jgi:hypothetical protein
VPTLEMELMIINVNWRPSFEDTNSSDYAELTENITEAVSFHTTFYVEIIDTIQHFIIFGVINSY